MSMYGVRFIDPTYGGQGVHSFFDWGVYFTGMDKEYPNPRKVLIDVPFRNGLVDATPILTNKYFYENRKITFHFKVIDSLVPWQELHSRIARDIHGKTLNVIADVDPEFYWQAYNCVLTSPSSNEDVGEFSIECDCNPYKYDRIPHEEVYIIAPNLEYTFTFTNLKLQNNPRITNNASVILHSVGYYDAEGNYVTFNDSVHDYTIPVHTTSTADRSIVLHEGVNVLKFSKTGSNTTTVRFRLTRGDL